MVKKDTSSAVLSMLSERGASFRPSGTAPHALPGHDDPESSGPSAAEEADRLPVVAQQAPPATARRARKQAGAASAPDPAENAPRTLRLGQPMANALREAWLEAKREDVLLTYQDFADQVVRAGLRCR